MSTREFFMAATSYLGFLAIFGGLLLVVRELLLRRDTNGGRLGFALMLAGFVVCFVVWVAIQADARKQFMTDCTTEHHEYECTALWRAGDRDYVVTLVGVNK